MVEKWWAETPIGFRFESNKRVRLQPGLDALFAVPIVLGQTYNGEFGFSFDRQSFKFTFANGIAEGPAQKE